MQPQTQFTEAEFVQLVKHLVLDIHKDIKDDEWAQDTVGELIEGMVRGRVRRVVKDMHLRFRVKPAA